jgi:YD repeat-containing protein
MSDISDIDEERVGIGRSNKRMVLKITSVIVVALMILLAYHGLQIDTSGSDPPTPPKAPNRGNAGYEEFYNYVGGMVNTANGNLVYSQKDISLKAGGFNIEIIRTFNTQERTFAHSQDYFGYGWTCNYFIYLDENPNTRDVTLTEGDGSVHNYTFDTFVGRTSYYLTPAGKHARLNKNVDRTYILRFLDGSEYNFDTNGILLNITDKNNNKLKFTYNSGKLIKIEQDLGGLLGGGPQPMYLNLSYSGNNISNITDPYGRKIAYNYNNGVLTDVTDPMGNTTLYSYEIDGMNQTALLDSVVDRVDWRLNFTYDDNITLNAPIVTSIYNSMWNRSSNSSYNSFKMYDFTAYYVWGSPGSDTFNDTYITTNFTDARGYAWSVDMNDYGNPLKIVDPNGNYTTSLWDTDFNKISYTDKLNRTYEYTYYNYIEGNNVRKTYGLHKKSIDPSGNYTEYGWNFTNNATTYVALLNYVTNKRSHTTTYTYDNYYNLNKTTDARGNISTMTYDGAGNVVSRTDFRGFTTTFTHDMYGNIVNITDPGGNVTQNKYDTRARLKNVTDARGYTTHYEYDDLDRIVKITDAFGYDIQYIYGVGGVGHYSTGVQSEYSIGIPINSYHFDILDQVNMPISIIYADGLQINLTLNHTIKRIDQIDESKESTTRTSIFSYDKKGNLVKFTNSRNYITTYSYDSLDRLINKTDARGNSTIYTYNNEGKLLTVTNRRGYITSYEYDNMNRKTKETDSLGNFTEYTYDEEGNLKTIKNGRGYITTFYYDELNKLIQTKDALNHSSYITYDENGNKASKTDPNGNTINYYYDSLNQLIVIKNALNHEIKYDYDANGNLLNITDANGNITNKSYNALGQLISITDASNNVTSYSYNSVGLRLNCTDANNKKTEYEYDEFRRINKIIRPSGNQTQYKYDNGGNLVKRIDSKNLTTNYTYNEVDLLVKIEYPNGGFIDYEYNEIGNIIKISNNAEFNEFTSCTYDALNRLISNKINYGLFNKTINYTWDENSNRKTMTDSEGNVTSYIYNALDRITNITFPGSKTFLFQYDNGSRRTRLDYPSGAYNIYSYDNENKITSIRHYNSNGSTIVNYSYTYDKEGNILNHTENNENYTTYTYDNNYRIINVSYPDNTWSAYTYDGVGNRLSSKNSSSNLNYSYNSDYRLLTYENTTFKYDNNGNLINKTENDDTTLFEYNYDNRLIKIIFSNSSTISYNFSALGQCIKRTDDSESIFYNYDNENILMELDNNGNKNVYYLNDKEFNVPLTMIKNGISYEYHNDISSIRVVTDISYNIVASYNYDDFGYIIEETGTLDNIYRFNPLSMIFESSLNSYHHNGIFYEPENRNMFSNQDEYLNEIIVPFSISQWPYDPYESEAGKDNIWVGEVVVYDWMFDHTNKATVGGSVWKDPDQNTCKYMGDKKINEPINFVSFFYIKDTWKDGPHKQAEFRVRFQDWSNNGAWTWDGHDYYKFYSETGPIPKKGFLKLDPLPTPKELGYHKDANHGMIGVYVRLIATYDHEIDFDDTRTLVWSILK